MNEYNNDHFAAVSLSTLLYSCLYLVMSFLYMVLHLIVKCVSTVTHHNFDCLQIPVAVKYYVCTIEWNLPRFVVARNHLQLYCFILKVYLSTLLHSEHMAGWSGDSHLKYWWELMICHGKMNLYYFRCRAIHHNLYNQIAIFSTNRNQCEKWMLFLCLISQAQICILLLVYRIFPQLFVTM